MPAEALFDGAPATVLTTRPMRLRAHFDRMPDEKARQCDPAWSDEELVAWDGEFRSDGCLMLVCCDRDVDVAEYRRALEELQPQSGERLPLASPRRSAPSPSSPGGPRLP